MIALTVFISSCVTTVLCGLDYVAEANQRNDTAKSRKEAYQWILSQRNKDWGWGTRDFPQTHRTLTALYLSSEMQNETESLGFQLCLKQLELELSLALLKPKGQTSAGQLALYANALLATCRNPNDFYGYDIIKIIRSQPKLSVYAEALVSLAVSNSGNILSKRELLYYFDILDNYTEHTHVLPDTKAMIILALSSVMRHYREYPFIKAHLRQPLKLFKKLQKPDGSFGNIYTSALVMQALIGAGDKGDGWDFQKGVDYILSQQKEDGSFGDILATFFALPVLAGNSLVDLKILSCNTVNALSEDNDSIDEEWNGNVSVRYSVWGDTLKPISDVFTVPENSTFFDVMEEAKKLDDRYRFAGTSYSWGYYVQTIGNLTNDVACNKYWILYKVNKITGDLIGTENGVTKEIPENGSHYLFRYVKSSFASTDGKNTCEDRNDTDTTENNLDVDTTEISFVVGQND